MKVGHLKQVIEDMSNDNILFVAIFEKDEADEHAMSNLNDEKDFKFSAEQWENIVEKMERDEGIWNELMNSWRYYLEQKFDEIKKGNDVNSK
jgi:DNA replicative helicase MCM subunit Mcm2 (Cdc46/Mcm family)